MTVWFGGDYTPEQWPEQQRRDDMALMRDTGVTMATVGVFAWGLIEQQPGRYHWEWFDGVMDRLRDAGIAACLATMTASPPSWFADLYPQTLPVLADGSVLSQGARQHFCPSSPIYREHAVRFVRALAQRYGSHPALTLWHIGNEYGCHVSECYCETSAAAFRSWLRRRYTSIESLNHAWSTTVWSQRYEDFDEIHPPRTAPLFPNPAQRLDYARFSSDEMLECCTRERDVLREITPDIPVSTNFLSWGKPVDLFRWAEEIDVIGHDAYQDPADPDTHIGIGFAHDLMRGAKNGEPFLLMEQSPGGVNWRERNAVKPAGAMALWSWQAVAQGADSILFFQWRQSPGGAEKFHAGIVGHTGTRSRTYREVRELGQDVARAGGIAGSMRAADVAIVMDWDNWWALELDAHPTIDLDYQRILTSHYAPLFRANIATDVVHVSAELSRYRVVVVPNLYLVDQATADRLKAFVRGGGTLIVSYFSGIVDEADRVYLGGYGGPLRDVLGITIEEFRPLQHSESIGVRTAEGTSLRGSIWSEHLTLEGAESIAAYTEGELSGHPAITRHRFGDGVAYYLGTSFAQDALASILLPAVSAAGVVPELEGAPPGVQATRRRDETTEYLFLLNHAETESSVRIGEGWADLLRPESPADVVVTLGRREVRVLRRPSQRDPASGSRL